MFILNILVLLGSYRLAMGENLGDGFLIVYMFGNDLFDDGNDNLNII